MTPFAVTSQVLPVFPAVSGLTPLSVAPAAELALADGLASGDALELGLGTVLAWATPASIRVLAAVMTIKAGHRPMPCGRFRSKIFLLKRSDLTATAWRGGHLWWHLFAAPRG
jgi:hypothetical protein